MSKSATASPARGNRQIRGEERDTMGAELKAKYEAGATIRELADQVGRSYGFVNRVLKDVGADIRPRGGAHTK